ncbi:MAG TPA: alanine racemase [Chthoniobacteraceae bacterium]|nr:alanine racemase [Chthoniobacteraceae bacterium]
MDCAALRHNARLARERIGPRTALLAVVKANAYGHGMIEVAQALREEAELFGVANLHEAMDLRAGGIQHPILILGPSLPAEQAAINAHGFIATVSSYEEARAFAHDPAGINFEIDTGMGRLGCWQDDALAELEKISRIPGLKVHSVSTHLPVADEDAVFTREELIRFEDVVSRIRAGVPGAYRVHVLLSAGILYFPEHKYDLVRAGLMLYGSSPVPSQQHFLQPVMTFKSRVVLLRDLPAGRSLSYGRTFTTPQPMRVATIGAGYADGYPRSLSGSKAMVLVGGRRCPVLGRVTMDLTLVDVSAVPGVKLGDEAVLIGKQGGEEILVAEVAERAGTIAWEILTGIGSRVRRVYSDGR